VTFAVLHRENPVDNSVFAAYEEPTHFRCYPHEADLSLSVNIRTLGALSMNNQHSRSQAWIEKILAMLRQHSLRGEPWFDKWHVSSYYLASTMIMMFTTTWGCDTSTRFRWLLGTQRGTEMGLFWTYDGEETAYCLQACVGIGASVVLINLFSIGQHTTCFNTSTTKLPTAVIGKCLTCRCIVRSALFMALNSYMTQ
jgi:hypothetical protein